MKTQFTRSNKDNVATATLVAVSLFVLASGVFASSPAEANHQVDMAVQKMEPVVITASRATADVTLDTIRVSASRKFRQA